MPADPFVHWLLVLGICAGLAVAADVVLATAVRRLARRSSIGQLLQQRCQRPAAVLALLIALEASLGDPRLPAGARGLVSHLAALLLIATIAWLLTELTFVAEDLALVRLDIGAADNLRARRLRTQVVVFRRVTVVVVALVTAAVMLTTFGRVRALGASLLASAGIAGLAAGAAARPTLSNLAAGVQIAFTEPIRLDDVVIVEKEWGRVEEITLTYVVLRLWDKRRLVVPIAYFVEHPFQNWTRSTSDLVASALFYLDYRVPMDHLRAEFSAILSRSSRWDGRVASLQVTDTTQSTIEVRAIMSAVDSATAFDLRCEVREEIVGWLQQHYPESLPRTRTEVRSTELAAT